jgi:hypothetical protein
MLECKRKCSGEGKDMGISENLKRAQEKKGKELLSRI